MTFLQELAPTPTREVRDRRRIARQRAHLARLCLLNCNLCHHRCGVNRVTGELGPCRAGAETRFFSAQIESADELEIVPLFAIALSGCSLRCEFCVTAESSWNPRAGGVFNARSAAEAAGEALERGARTIMLLGGEPTIHLPALLELVAELPADAKLVLKTNTWFSAEAGELLAGLFDVWVADFKFGNDGCARRIGGITGYIAPVQDNLLRASNQTDLIVRHVLLPGHIHCCWEPIASWLATNMPAVKVSLRVAFWPAIRARNPELRRTLHDPEIEHAKAIARELGLGIVQ